MNPYGKVWRCKSSFLPHSDDPRVNHITPESCKRPSLLRLDSTGEISSDDPRPTMTGDKYRNKHFSTNCSRMRNLMNSTLFSWSRLSHKKQFMSVPRGETVNNNFEIINDMAKDMNKMAQEKERVCPARLDGTYGYRVPHQSAFQKPSLHNKMRSAFEYQPTFCSRNSSASDFSKHSDFGKVDINSKAPHTNCYSNMRPHWKNWHHHHQGGCRNRGDNSKVEDHIRKNSHVKLSSSDAVKENVGCTNKEVTMNSINMLKNILLQNEIINNAKIANSDNDTCKPIQPQDSVSSHSDVKINAELQGLQNVCELANDSDSSSVKTEVEPDPEKDFPDWFSMGRSDSVDGTGMAFPSFSICSAKIRSYSVESDNADKLGKSECEDLCNFKEEDDEKVKMEEDLQYVSVPKFENFESSQEKNTKTNEFCPLSNMNTTEETLADSGKTHQVHVNVKEESENVDSKDYSFILFVRNNNKKCRPSVKKRLRSKARMQECENTNRERKHISVNIESANQSECSNVNNADKIPDKCASSTVAFILGFDSEGDVPEATSSHSFVFSFSDSDTDSDFGSDDDVSEGEQCDDFNFPEFANPLNLNLICSVKKPEDTENSKLKALNLAWQINIQVNECKSKPDRKVHFADEKQLAEVHPMIAWSYAYQAARKGPWEEYARDRERFKKRIMDLEEIINPILQGDHRQKVYNGRLKC